MLPLCFWHHNLLDSDKSEVINFETRQRLQRSHLLSAIFYHVGCQPHHRCFEQLKGLTKTMMQWLFASRRLQLNPCRTEVIWFGSKSIMAKLCKKDVSLRLGSIIMYLTPQDPTWSRRNTGQQADHASTYCQKRDSHNPVYLYLRACDLVTGHVEVDKIINIHYSSSSPIIINFNELNAWSCLPPRDFGYVDVVDYTQTHTRTHIWLIFIRIVYLIHNQLIIYIYIYIYIYSGRVVKL